MKKFLTILVVILIIAVGGYFGYKKISEKSAQTDLGNSLKTSLINDTETQTPEVTLPAEDSASPLEEDQVNPTATPATETSETGETTPTEVTASPVVEPMATEPQTEEVTPPSLEELLPKDKEAKLPSSGPETDTIKIDVRK